ncbi:polysaccharide biosynthesis protein [Thalassobacillus sp. CUG 92003]|uniref:putative polysaccharide biosynthesis protein n=1 Tax=Thalassobacillus sp. CUG 92003 TaxID=2736641 RepID=UPI00210769CA|nr:polysaccharide biosynthesis protein [Thalassobacillus sp. CUG 92003]
MSPQNETKQVFKGAFLLTVAALVGKLLSAGYRVPLQNITGDLGFYIYQQIYPFLGAALVLSLYGFPAAISRIVAELKQQGYGLSLRSFYMPVFLILMAVCTFMSVCLYFGSEHIAYIMGDKQLKSSLQAASVIFLLLPAVSMFRGVFQGSGDMVPTAHSQLIEQLFRVTIIIVTALYVTSSRELYNIGTGAALGSLAGSLIAGLYLGMRFWRRHPWTHERWPVAYTHYLTTVALYGLFMCLNYMLLLLFQLADAFTLVTSLQDYGLAHGEARQGKGIFDRGYPLIQLGVVLGSSLALSLVPSVTPSRFKSRPCRVRFYIRALLKFSFVISAGATLGLALLFPEVNQVFFRNSAGSSPLRWMMLAIGFGAPAICVASILQGLGRVYVSAGMVAAGFMLKWGLNLWLIPLFGLKGAAAATVIATLSVLGGNSYVLLKTLQEPLLKFRTFVKVLACLSGMALWVLSLKRVETMIGLDSTRVGLLAFILFAVMTGALLYFALLLVSGSLSRREILHVPYGGSVARLLPRRK